MSKLPPIAEMQKAVAERDATYDGVFFLGVKTTGVFCCVNCPARRPKPQNLEFFPTAKQALLAGYRPCKRCRPMDTDGRPPAWVDRIFEEVERIKGRRIRDRDLRLIGIDPARARRYFKTHYGMTFQAYDRARRLGQAMMDIRNGASLDDVALGYGYESPSGFREAFGKTFGATPGQSRGSDCILTATIESPIGPLIVCATSDAMCLLEFTDRRAIDNQFKTLRKHFACAVVPGRNGPIDQAEAELAEYFAGRRRAFTVPLVYPGTPFQVAVWKRLIDIPYGETISYEQLAADVERPGAQRAVGMTNGMNRIGIIIPCHRVVNKNGKLGGYGGGLWRKQFLLDLERGDRSLLP